MTEKAKTMGRIEYGIGAYITALIGSYLIPGINPPIEFLWAGALVVGIYFGHWFMTEISLELADNRLLKRLELEKKYAQEEKTRTQRPSETPVPSL